jgi:hypothetical protein
LPDAAKIAKYPVVANFAAMEEPRMKLLVEEHLQEKQLPCMFIHVHSFLSLNKTMKLADNLTKLTKMPGKALRCISSGPQCVLTAKILKMESFGSQIGQNDENTNVIQL